MANKTTSGTEKRALKNLVNTRFDDLCFAWVRREAETYGVTNASVIRDLVADEVASLSTEDKEALLVKRKRRRSVPVVPPHILQVGQFIEEISRIGNNLNQAMRDIHIARKSGDVSEEMYRTIKSRITKAQITISMVKTVMLEGMPDDDDDDGYVEFT